MKEAKSQTINLCRALPRQGRGRVGEGEGEGTGQGGERGDRGVHLAGEAACFFACSFPGQCPVRGGGWS